MPIGIKKKEEVEPPKKQDSQFNPADSDGLWSEVPRQSAGIGVYKLCECKDKQKPVHRQVIGVTRFWCMVCGNDLTYNDASEYMYREGAKPF
ncbi:hypothetical protein [Serratia sp. (in: enterobacteria)]|uniref:hypothetical protein n=1 Tax=Serratia sp. (in: enterobacteria) TaxID=616 RepID=UPI003989179F